MINYMKKHRQTREERLYWSVYVIGIYEYGDFTAAGFAFGRNDNDPNSEFGLTGWTLMNLSEFSIIPMEIGRDVAAQHNWTAAQILHVQRMVTAHEIGHQFQLGHTPTYPNHLVSAPPNAVDSEEPQIPNMPIQFTEADIGEIRQVKKL